ncbi:hypothetical protein ACQCP0_24545, partial [Ralstonia pseudosolanacearum]
QRYRHVVARKRQHGLTTTLIYATTPSEAVTSFSFFVDLGSRKIFAASDAAFFSVAMVASKKYYYSIGFTGLR